MRPYDVPEFLELYLDFIWAVFITAGFGLVIVGLLAYIFRARL